MKLQQRLTQLCRYSGGGMELRAVLPLGKGMGYVDPCLEKSTSHLMQLTSGKGNSLEQMALFS